MDINQKLNDFLEAGVHFGHNSSKWNPNMAPFIFMEHNGIHLIDLKKTINKLEISSTAIQNVAKSGRKILFVATKKQAKDIIEKAAKRVGMPFVTERWLGGMLTNFATVRKSLKKLTSLDQMLKDGTASNLNKKERLMMMREKEKLEAVLGGISDLKRLPAALFVVDIKKEHIAIAEAIKLNLTTFAIVDTNSDPTKVDFPIPANDDSTKSIAIIMEQIISAIEEGLNERKLAKEDLERDKKGFDDLDEDEEEKRLRKYQESLDDKEGRDQKKRERRRINRPQYHN
jgi:small subunit ribosomal protein S2